MRELQQLEKCCVAAQIATANAMASTCTSSGGCDFVINTGDNFYDLGITGGTADPQWGTAFQVIIKLNSNNNKDNNNSNNNKGGSLLIPHPEPGI